MYVILVKGHLTASPGASSQKPQNQGPAPYYKIPQVKFLSSSYYTGSGQKKTKMLQKEKEWQESQRQTRKRILDSKTVIKSMVTAASVRQWCRRQDAICPTSLFRFQLTNNDAINTFLLLFTALLEVAYYKSQYLLDSKLWRFLLPWDGHHNPKVDMWETKLILTKWKS